MTWLALPLPPVGQRPISLEYQIYLSAIDTLVSGMVITAIVVLTIPVIIVAIIVVIIVIAVSFLSLSLAYSSL